MPGNVENATVLSLMPPDLCNAFAEERVFHVRQSDYADGSGQCLAETIVCRKSFTLTRRLTAEQLAILRDFYFAQGGATTPFHFYFGPETSPIFSHGATGQDPTGRYTLRFEGDFSLEIGLGRISTNITLIEIA